jgi:hypothetical protein
VAIDFVDVAVPAKRAAILAGGRTEIYFLSGKGRKDPTIGDNVGPFLCDYFCVVLEKFFRAPMTKRQNLFFTFFLVRKL